MNNILIIYVEINKNIPIINTINSFITNCNDIGLVQNSICLTDNEKYNDVIKNLNIRVLKR